MKKYQIFKKIIFFLIAINKIEIVRSNYQTSSSNNTEADCILQNNQDFDVSKDDNVSNSTEPCCPKGFQYKENSFGDHCIPDSYFKARTLDSARTNFGECYFCRENKNNEKKSHPKNEKYTYICKDFGERCRESCEDDHTCQGSCYKGYDWCPERQECLRDNLQCDCGPIMLNCNSSCITMDDYKANKGMYKICKSGDCLLKEDSCPKPKIGCQAESWVCGTSCQLNKDFTNFRRCQNREQSDHDCIPIGQECLKEPPKDPSSETVPENNMETLKFIIIICVIFLVLVITIAFLIRCFITMRIKRKEIIFLDDNPEYGMAQPEYRATQVCDNNEYYGADEENNL